MYITNENEMNFVKENFNQIQNKLLIKNSLAEKHFCNLLNNANISYSRERGNYQLYTRWCYFDFYIPKLRLYIEIDGKEHKLKKNKEIDIEKQDIILSKGKYFLRLTNDFVLSLNYINENDLIKLLAKKKNKNKKKKNFENKYLKNIEKNYNRAVEDMRKTADFIIDENQKVYGYDNKSGQYYEFNNIFDAKLTTELSINHVNRLLNEEYKKSSSRRWVFGYTMNECELNVMKVYDL